jgi:PAS domain S-box-containing protein
VTDRSTPDERRFRALASSSAERIAELDSFGRTVYTSPSHAEKGDDALASLDSVHPDDREKVGETFTAAYADGKPRRVTFRVVEIDGRTRWVECALTPFAGDDGRHVLVASRDVSERVEIEKNLRESRERFQRIAENAYDMIVECDSDWKIVYANDRVQEILGFPDPEQLTDGSHLHPDDLAETAGIFDQIAKRGSDAARTTFRTRHADGGWRWVDVNIRAIERAGDARHILVIGRDVTDRHEAEQQLRDSEQRYRDLVEDAPVGIVVVQDEGIVYANPTTARMACADDPRDLAGMNFFRFLDAEEGRRIAGIMAASLGGDAVPSAVEVTIRRLDGELRNVEATISVIRYRGAPAMQAIVRDVTEIEQDRRERRRLELQLQEARKLESLGVLAGGIAHDFNNLLAVILSSVRYARDAGPDELGRAEALRDAEEAAQGAARLVTQLLDYAGRRSPEVRDVDLSELTRSMVDLLRSAMPGGVTLELALDPDPLWVHADLVQLEQVLMNLVLNASHAVGAGPGTVRVRTSRRRLTRAELASWLGGETLVDGVYACLEVEDTGVGMDAETRSRMFDPFFTTKVQGHGLGLSAVLGLVQGHGGAIDVRSAPRKGTRLAIVLPTTRRGRSTRPRPLLLLADPDAVRRRAVVEALADRADVLEAAGADELLDLWALYGDDLDAALLGAALEKDDRPPLAASLRNDRPELALAVFAGNVGEERLCEQAKGLLEKAGR